MTENAKRKIKIRRRQASWRAFIRRDLCAYCLRYDETMTTDHITPLAAGGRAEIANLAPCCKACNMAKGTMGLFAFLQFCIQTHRLTPGRSQYGRAYEKRLRYLKARRAKTAAGTWTEIAPLKAWQREAVTA